MSSRPLPYSLQDVGYDNAKFRHRFRFKVITQALITRSIRYDCRRCSIGKFLMLLMIAGLAYLMVVHKVCNHSTSSDLLNDALVGEDKFSKGGVHTIGRFWRKPPRLPPQLPPDEGHKGTSDFDPNKLYPMSEWISRQQKVKEAFLLAWSGYKSYAIGYDELMPLSHKGIDGLGGLGSSIIDSLDTAMIIGADEIVSEAEMWIEEHLMERINTKGVVNLFETTIRVLGGLLSAYHLSRGEHGTLEEGGISVNLKGAKPEVFLKIAKNLADKLLAAFTSSPTSIPFSDVILHDSTAHPAPDSLSSTSEVSTLQLEFNYLCKISGDRDMVQRQ